MICRGHFQPHHAGILCFKETQTSSRRSSRWNILDTDVALTHVQAMNEEQSCCLRTLCAELCVKRKAKKGLLKPSAPSQSKPSSFGANKATHKVRSELCTSVESLFVLPEHAGGEDSAHITSALTWGAHTLTLEAPQAQDIPGSPSTSLLGFCLCDSTMCPDERVATCAAALEHQQAELGSR